MKKILLLTTILLLAVEALWAAHIDENRAREIAQAFFAASATRSAEVDVELEWAGNKVSNTASVSVTVLDDKPTLYIYNRSDNRGFVIIAGKECNNPIVAYSDTLGFDFSNMAPSTRAILEGWSRQIEVSTEDREGFTQASELVANGQGNVICHYDTALWDQTTPYNNECPEINGYQAVTGCVATSMAIVCHYNKWPQKGIGTIPSYSYIDDYGQNHTISANRLGRTYSYSDMLHDYSTMNYTTTQGNAVAALMYDMGTSVGMMYHYNASGAFSELIPSAMSTYFGYSKEATLFRRDGYTSKEWYNILKKNLDKCGPSLYGGSGDEGGHAFVVDGYTDKNYFHFNFGWSGANNGFYRTPEIEYYYGQDVILNLVPDKNNTSEYIDYLTLIDYQWGDLYFTGIMPYSDTIEQNTPFSILVGCISNNGEAIFNGDIGVAICDKYDNIKQVIKEESLGFNLNPGYISYAEFTDLTISSEIKSGDVLRIVYKGNNPDKWQIMQGSSEAVVDKIQLKDPNIIAKNLTLRYEKNYNNSGKRAIIISSKVSIDYVCRPTNGVKVIAQGSCSSGEERAIIINSTLSLPMILELTDGSTTHSINITI